MARFIDQIWTNKTRHDTPIISPWPYSSTDLADMHKSADHDTPAASDDKQADIDSDQAVMAQNPPPSRPMGGSGQYALR